MVQHPKTKLWNTYGIVTQVGLNRQYFVNTERAKILIRNHRFLQKRVPASIPPRMLVRKQPPLPKTLLPRRSTWLRTSANRLIEDPSWLDGTSIAV